MPRPTGDRPHRGRLQGVAYSVRVWVGAERSAGRSADTMARAVSAAIQARKRSRAAANRFRWGLQLMVGPSGSVSRLVLDQRLRTHRGREVVHVVEVRPLVGGGPVQVSRGDQVIHDL